MSLAAWLIERPRYFKRTLLIINDFVMLSIALWAAYSLRLSQLYVPDDWFILLLMAAAPVVGVIVFSMRGLYKLVTRFIGPEGTTRIYTAVIIAAVMWALVVLMSGIQGQPRSVVVIYALIAAGLIRLSRQWAGALLLRAAPQHKPLSFDERKNVIIYGAGPIGIQLLRALNETGHYRTVAFIDSNPSLAGQFVHGVKVARPEKLGRLIADENVKEVLLATPSALRSERRVAIRLLEDYPVVVKTLPALEEIASGRVEVSDLRAIDVEDLLGRDPVSPDLELLTAQARGKVVMITGAGGSIGSELTRQLLRLEPKTLVLLDVSEAALYEITLEIQELQRRRHNETEGMASETRVVQVLGSVLDRQLVARTIEGQGVDVIYHAAAYKHVPIVETNPFAGLQNNTFGTLVVAETAKELGVKRVVLVSSDKAVRPTNIMGASKRLAELILQGLAQECTSTIFTMVRFGNVLDSSGSVVRLFRNQIKAGGPVTVTHPEVIRYFMSIPEAAQLVIQAGAMATGGEVFVLEMGSPVKIDDLARTMIRLSGLEVRDESHPDGDIAIEYIGLRRGLEDAIKRVDESELQAMLRATVEGYMPTGAVHTGSVKGEWQPASRTLH
jgi:FlaA1/EpsC-like NDP-sugar epimerase